MAALAAEILQHPLNRARVARAALARLREIEAAEAAEEAELQEQIAAGSKADHDRELARCADGIEGCIHWFRTWVWTYNPKLIGQTDPETGAKLSPFIRFIPWSRQEDLLRWVHDQVENGRQGACKKSRDIGASYLFVGYALWRWLFTPGFKATFGSRVLEYVDQLDNPDTLFAKARIMLRRLPLWMLPDGFNWAKHDNIGRISNPANEAVITGEGGKNMGRGGRSTMYVLDEAGHVENAEAIEAALSGNTDAIFWVSSANGMGNLFFRKCHGGLPAEQVFEFHYRDDPRKTAAWVAAKKRVTEAVVWAQEYEIDFSASLEGVCIPAAWVRSAQELRRRVGVRPHLLRAETRAGLDVGAGGKGKSVFVSRQGPYYRVPKSRGDPDTINTAHWALGLAVAEGVRLLNYDAPGVGVGVTSALNKVPQITGDGPTRPALFVTAVNTGEGAPTSRIWPDGRSSKDKFGNLKAEIWWLTRTRCQKSHELLQWMDGVVDDDGEPLGKEHPLDECALLPSGDPESDLMCAQLSMVKADKNIPGKIVIESKAALKKRGIPSPDYADAAVLTEVDQRPTYRIDALA